MLTDWQNLLARLSPAQLNPSADDPNALFEASPDAGCEALAYVHAYRVVNNKRALSHAVALVAGAYFEYGNPEGRDHGVTFNDSLEISTLNKIALGLTCWGLHEATGESKYFDFARFTYDWIHEELVRPDDLYEPHPKLRKSRELTVSASLLTANMGVALLGWRLGIREGDTSYLLRATATTNALASLLARSDEGYLNDFDTRKSGAFLIHYAFATEVLGSKMISSKNKESLFKALDSLLRSNAFR